MPVLGRLRQEHSECTTSLDYIRRPYHIHLSPVFKIQIPLNASWAFVKAWRRVALAELSSPSNLQMGELKSQQTWL